MNDVTIIKSLFPIALWQITSFCRLKKSQPNIIIIRDLFYIILLNLNSCFKDIFNSNSLRILKKKHVHSESHRWNATI